MILTDEKTLLWFVTRSEKNKKKTKKNKKEILLGYKQTRLRIATQVLHVFYKLITSC